MDKIHSNYRKNAIFDCIRRVVRARRPHLNTSECMYGNINLTQTKKLLWNETASIQAIASTSWFSAKSRYPITRTKCDEDPQRNISSYGNNKYDIQTQKNLN